MSKAIIKSREKFTKKQANKLVELLTSKLTVHCVYSMDKDCKYYHSLTGWNNGKYFSIGIYCFTDRHKIDYSHNTLGRRELNVILKEAINQVKK